MNRVVSSVVRFSMPLYLSKMNDFNWGWDNEIPSLRLPFFDGFFSKTTNDDHLEHLVKTSCYSMKGSSRYMEDQFFISKGNLISAVFDGHGGNKVSSYLSDQFNEIFYDYINENDTISNKQIISKITTTLQSIDKEIMKKDELEYQGSTAAISVINPVVGSFITINVGDSRVVLSRNGTAVPLTEDHKPNSSEERKRIEKLGGTVDLLPDKGYRVNGNLLVSRAIGDRAEGPVISSEPTIKTFPIDEDQDQFIIVASDGLWDILSSQKAVNFVNKMLECAEGGFYKNPDNHPILKNFLSEIKNDRKKWVNSNAFKKSIAKLLALAAFKRGAWDNITVIIQWL